VQYEDKYSADVAEAGRGGKTNTIGFDEKAQQFLRYSKYPQVESNQQDNRLASDSTGINSSRGLVASGITAD
jgi:hypothetical protein